MNGAFDCSNYGKLDVSTLGLSLGYSHASFLGTDEGINLGSPDNEVLGIKLGDEDGITLGRDKGNKL